MQTIHYFDICVTIFVIFGSCHFYNHFLRIKQFLTFAVIFPHTKILQQNASEADANQVSEAKIHCKIQSIRRCCVHVLPFSSIFGILDIGTNLKRKRNTRKQYINKFRSYQKEKQCTHHCWWGCIGIYLNLNHTHKVFVGVQAHACPSRKKKQQQISRQNKRWNRLWTKRRADAFDDWILKPTYAEYARTQMEHVLNVCIRKNTQNKWIISMCVCVISSSSFSLWCLKSSCSFVILLSIFSFSVFGASKTSFYHSLWRSWLKFKRSFSISKQTLEICRSLAF